MKLQNDTIAAISTGMGEAAISIIRLSGPGSQDIISSIIALKKPKILDRTLFTDWLEDPEDGQRIDNCVLIVRRAPNSYTGEDMVEIQCHGGSVIANRILQILIDKGARLADRGEFTKRAFVNGRTDLIEAEAVIDAIRAKTGKGAKEAAKRLSGELSRKIAALTLEIKGILAEIEASTDFPEDVEEPDNSTTIDRLKKVLAAINVLNKDSLRGIYLNEGIRAVIVGKPNAGKSTLLNAILRMERAIVTNMPGTTTDTIEEVVSIDGFPVRFIDTAGIRGAKNEIERIGIGKTHKAIEEADIVIVVFDNSTGIDDSDDQIIEAVKGKKAIFVLNKVDLKGPGAPIRRDFPSLIQAIASKGEGIRQIEEALLEDIISVDSEEVSIANLRQKGCLIEAEKSIWLAIETMQANNPIDMASIDIKEAIMALGQITGENVSSDVIDQIFEGFCIGK